MNEGSLFCAPSPELRTLGYRVKSLLQMKSSASTSNASAQVPQSRHANDSPDFRGIAILPTPDEFGSSDNKSSCRRAEEISRMPDNQRVEAHIDNQFRLLREDMVSELRESFQIAQGQKMGHRPALYLGGLAVASIYSGWSNGINLQPCTVGVHFRAGLEGFRRLPTDRRKEYLQLNRDFVKHESFGCLLRGLEIVAFATVVRDITKLTAPDSEIMLQITGHEGLRKALTYMKLYDDVDFLFLESRVSEYEPILKCLQDKQLRCPLIDDLFLYTRDKTVGQSSLIPANVTEGLEERSSSIAQDVFDTVRPVKLDNSQLESLLSGLTQRVSMIQGPPGMFIYSRKSCAAITTDGLTYLQALGSLILLRYSPRFFKVRPLKRYL